MMENTSKIIDDSASMYFSFNSTIACKTMESEADNSSKSINNDGNCSQNSTLEAHDTNHTLDKIQTVKKLSFGVSPIIVPTLNRLKTYNAISSTPTSAQLQRSVNVNRGSMAGGDVCDLGLAFLEDPPEPINANQPKDKENQPPSCEEVAHLEISSDIVLSETDKILDGNKSVKGTFLSNLPVLRNTNIRGTPNLRRSIPKCVPNIVSEAHQGPIYAAVPKKPDILSPDSEEVTCSDTSSERGCSEIEKTPEGKRSGKEETSSDQTVLKNPNIRGTPNVRRSILNFEFVQAPTESINVDLPSAKELLSPDSEEATTSEKSSETEKTLDEKKTVKGVVFSNLPVLKNPNMRRTLNIRRSMPKCEPDLASNRPSRIIPRKTMSAIPKASNQSTESPSQEIPQMLNSMLKISKGESLSRKSIGTSKNPFNLLGNATRMSIVKTTLNSPARKVSLKCLTSVNGGRNPVRQSILPVNKRRSITAQCSSAVAPRRSVMLPTNRKSILKTSTAPRRSVLPVTKNMAKTSSTSPNKKNSRKSIFKPPATSMVATSLKRIVSDSPTFETRPLNTQNKPTKIKILNGLKEDFLCEVCSRKFRVLSLFEAHKRTHNVVSSTSNKQTSSAGNDKQCQYCDRKFAIAKALENHLIQNCTKIPPEDRKKFVPPFQLPPPKLAMSNFPSSSKKIPNRRSQFNRKDANLATIAPATSVNKLKKELAHSGVYCTPKKQIVCHICKAHFNNILAFTEHKLSHSNATTNNKNDTDLTKSSQIQLFRDPLLEDP